MTVPFTPLDPRGTVLGDEVYSRLGEAILDGTLAPGERLRDQELAERLGVSRTPVREALQRLERTGLVEVAPNRYTRVTTPNDKVQADVYEFVVYLMGSAVRMAVARVLRRGAGRCPRRRRRDGRGIPRRRSRGRSRAPATPSSPKMTRASEQRRDRRASCARPRSRSGATLPGWHPFIECPIGRTAAYESFRDAVAGRDGDRAESVLRD